MSAKKSPGRDDCDDDRDDDGRRGLTIRGTNRNDTLTGTGGNDNIFGGKGNDYIAGGAGKDTLDGGAGNDRLDGGSGKDTLTGGAGNDNLDGGSGIDVAVYTGNFRDYKLTLSRDGGHSGACDDDNSAMTVHDKRSGSPDGVDVLKNVEILRFADGEYRNGQFFPNHIAPVADTKTVNEDNAATGNVLANDGNVNNTLSVASFQVAGDAAMYAAGTTATIAGKGTLTIASNGNYTFTPVLNWNGAVPQVTYTVNTGLSATLDITVSAVDDASVLAADTKTVNEDNAAAGNVLSNDLDVDNTLSVASFQVAGDAAMYAAGTTATIAGKGTLTIAANGSYTFTPLANWNGAVPQITYTVNTGSSATFDITVSAVDDAPTLGTSLATLAEGATVVLSATNLAGTDADNSAAQLTYTLGTAPVHGTLKLNGTALAAGGTFTQADVVASLVSYTHHGGETTSDSLAVRLSDGNSITALTTLALTVTPVNDAPTLSTSLATVAEGTTVVLSATNLAGADADNTNSQLRYAVATAPVNGALKLNGIALAANDTFTQADVIAGRVTYTHNGSETSSDSVSLSLSDGQATPVLATLALLVTPVNDAPVATAVTVNTGENAVLSTTVPLVAGDVDGTIDPLGYALVSGVGANNGTLNFLADGTYSFNPGTDFDALAFGASRDVSFSYTARDNLGLASTPQTVTIHVTGSNDAPVATAVTVNTGENATLSTTVPLVAGDVDGTIDPLGYALVTGVGANNGTLTFNTNGTYSFNPGTDFDAVAAGADRNVSFSYTARDNLGLASAPQTVTIHVTGSNDAPVATSVMVHTNENAVLSTTVPLVASDVDGTIDPLGYALTSGVGANNGMLTFLTNGTYSFNPGADFDAVAAGADRNVSFTYTARDNLGLASAPQTVTIHVTGSNDAPVATAVTVNTGENAVLSTTVPLVASDVDGTIDPLGYALVSGVGANNGTLNFLANGTYSFNPGTDFDALAAGASRDVSFSYTARDNLGLASAPQTVTIHVTGSNDAPTLSTSQATLAKGTTVVLSGTNLAGADIDNENSQLTYTLGTPLPSYGTLKLNGNLLVSGGHFTQADVAAGRVTYTHDGSESSIDSLSLGLSDGQAAPVLATLGLTVILVSETVVAYPDTVEVNEDTEITGAVLTNDDGSPTQAYSFAGPSNGTLTFNLDGTFSYMPHLNFNGTDTFTYRAYDGILLSNEATVTITVTPVNDAPTLSTSLVTLGEGETVVLSGTNLAGADADNTAAQLTYAVGALPVNGTLKLNETTLAVGGTFTQADVAAGLVSYTHDGSETTSDSLAVDLGDGNLTTALTTLALTVTPVNDAPTLSTVAATVGEGETVVLSATNLVGADVDNTNSQLTYTVGTLPVHGTLKLNGLALAVGSHFTQTDVAAGRVSYTHDGSETTSDSLAVDLGDGISTTVLTTLALTVTPFNDAPMLSTAAATVSEGATVVLSATNLAGADVDNANSQITYTLGTAPVSGALELDGIALTANGVFTQDDVINGRLTYTHDGGETTGDSLAVSLSDGNSSTALTTLALTVTPVNDAPTLSIAAATLDEGATVVLSAMNLAGADADNADSQLTYTLGTAPVYGTLNLNGAALGFGGTFTQDDVSNGRLTYTHDGSETTGDSLALSLSDGNSTTALTTLALTVTPVNDAPVAVGETRTIQEDEVVVLSAANATDAEHDTLTIVSVQGAIHGTAELVDGVVTFRPDLNYGGPAINYLDPAGFSYTVSDGHGGTADATVTLNITAVADAPIIPVPKNLGFELNSFVNWELLGGVGLSSNYDGVVPVDGTHMSVLDSTWELQGDLERFLRLDAGALNGLAGDAGLVFTNVTDGSAMRTSLAVSAGDDVTFDWNFLATDRLPYGDFGFVAINGVAERLAGNVDVGSYGTSGWHTYTYHALASGVLNLGFGVVDTGDNDSNGKLFIDNVRYNGSAASGDEDTAFRLPIGSRLADTDGSESLSNLTISGVPSGAIFADALGIPVGLHDGNGNWTLTAAQLEGLTITPPPDFFGTFTLTVTATSTEFNGDQATATKSFEVNVGPVSDGSVPDSLVIVPTDSGAVGLNIAAPTNIFGDAHITQVPSNGTVTLGGGAVVAAGSTLTVSDLAALSFMPTGATGSHAGLIYTWSDTPSPSDADNQSAALSFSLVNALGAVRVAVVYSHDLSAEAAADIADQLEDDSYFDFSATMLQVSAGDTKESLFGLLQAYDVVVSAASNGDAMTPAYWSALHDYVATNQGGVVTTGRFATTLSTALVDNTDADFVSPIAPGGYTLTSGAAASFAVDSSHPITQGIDFIAGFASQNTFLEGAVLDPGLDVHSLADHPDGGSVIAYKELVNGGREVYLGEPYASSESSSGTHTEPLRSGLADQLFEQAVNWAARGATETRAVSLSGGAGNDVLSGGADDDTLSGGAGSDKLTGAGGSDSLTGGSGSDRFYYNSVDDGEDTITDFTSGLGGDVLDIHDVLSGYTGANASNFVQLEVIDATHTRVIVNADGVDADFVPLAILNDVGMTPTLLNDLLQDNFYLG